VLQGYLEEYEIPGRHSTDFRRLQATYLNELAQMGCRISEIAEPRPRPRGTYPIHFWACVAEEVGTDEFCVSHSGGW
jgi:hypothetical protein